MSQKTLFTSLLAVAVALISTRRPARQAFSQRILGLGWAYSGEAQLPMMQVNVAHSCIDYHV
ncbi:hypothetical protein ACNKHV_14890 [Shigella flexneri]